VHSIDFLKHDDTYQYEPIPSNWKHIKVHFIICLKLLFKPWAFSRVLFKGVIEWSSTWNNIPPSQGFHVVSIFQPLELDLPEQWVIVLKEDKEANKENQTQASLPVESLICCEQHKEDHVSKIFDIV